MNPNDGIVVAFTLGELELLQRLTDGGTLTAEETVAIEKRVDRAKQAHAEITEMLAETPVEMEEM